MTIEKSTRAARSAAFRSLSAEFPAGSRVETHPATDAWMRGDRFGSVVKVGKLSLHVYVKLDKSGRTRMFQPHNLVPCEPLADVPPVPTADASEAFSGRRTVLGMLLVLFLLALPSWAAEPCKVNVNTANVAQVALLVRTGPVLAGRIVQARQAAGTLTLETLDAVKGIGPAWLQANAEHVTFDGPTTCTEKQHAPKGGAR